MEYELSDVNPNCPIFEVIFDGNMKLAKTIVLYYRNSHNFTHSFPEIDDFYNLFMSSFMEMKDKIYREYSKIPILDIEEIEKDLIQKYKNNTLQMIDFLRAYSRLLYFYQINVYNVRVKYDDPSTYSKYEAKNIYQDTEITHRLVPFISKSGYYGLNTYLFLYFNRLFAIGTSINGYKFHKLEHGPYKLFSHDLGHTFQLLNLTPFNKNNTSLTYFNHLKNIYERMILMKNILDDSLYKAFIIFLFISIHEGLIVVNCPFEFKIPGIINLYMYMRSVFRNDPNLIDSVKINNLYTREYVYQEYLNTPKLYNLVPRYLDHDPQDILDSPLLYKSLFDDDLHYGACFFILVHMKFCKFFGDIMYNDKFNGLIKYSDIKFNRE